MPTIQANDDNLKEIYEKIDKLINPINGKIYLIILGGWDASVGEDQDGKKCSNKEA